MKIQYSQKLSSSFALFLEHHLLLKGEAYSNVNKSLFPSSFSKIGNSNVYQSPSTQWVYDSSVTGAVIPTSFTGDGNSISRGQGGAKIDFTRGRVYSDTSYSNVSCEYAKKDFNFYFAPEREVIMLLESLHGSKKVIAPTEDRQGVQSIDPSKIVAPCILLHKKSQQNEGFSFGGEDKTTSIYQVTIVSSSKYNLEGAISIFGDLNEVCFPVIDPIDIPFDAYGDLKQSTFNYKNLYSQYPSPSQRCYIDKARPLIVKGDAYQEADKFFIGMCEFYLESYRWPRME